MPSYTPATCHALPCVLITSLLLIGTTACNRTPTPTPAHTERIDSGGLGLTRAEWEQKHSLVWPIVATGNLYDQKSVPEGAYIVHYWHKGPAEPDSRIVGIAVDARTVLSDAGKLNFREKRRVTVEEIRSAFMMLLPTDAELVETKHFPQQNDSYIETYMSRQLETAYEPLPEIGLPWTYDPVGSITVQYMGGFNEFGIEVGIAHLLLEPEATPIPTWTPGLPEPLTSPVPTYVPPVSTSAVK